MGRLETNFEPRFGSQFAASMLVTHKVAAAILGVSAKTLRRMWKEGQISGVRRPTGEIRFAEADLCAYLESHAMPGHHRVRDPMTGRTPWR